MPCRINTVKSISIYNILFFIIVQGCKTDTELLGVGIDINNIPTIKHYVWHEATFGHGKSVEGQSALSSANDYMSVRKTDRRDLRKCKRPAEKSLGEVHHFASLDIDTA